MSKPVRIGMVGLGQRGLQHLKALWKIEDANIVALCDPFADNLEPEKISRFVGRETKIGSTNLAQFPAASESRKW